MTRLVDVQKTLDYALQDLEPLFQPHCRLTLLMRNPQVQDGDLLLSKDDLREVERAIARLRAKESPEWILSCEQMPPDDSLVWVTHDNNGALRCTIGRWLADDREWWICTGEIVRHVTAWKPIDMLDPYQAQ